MKKEAAFHHVEWDEVKKEIDLIELKTKLKKFTELSVSISTA